MAKTTKSSKKTVKSSSPEMCSMSCWSSEDCKRFALSVFAVFVTIFSFESLFHGYLLKDAYQATQNLWRSVDEMNGLYHIIIIRQIIQSIAIVCLFKMVAKNFDTSGCGSPIEIKFGVKIGLLLGAMQYGVYAYMPIPISLAFSWFVGEIVLGLLVGVILLIIKKMNKSV